MRLLVTRPEPDATELKAHLTARGHQVTVEPLLVVRFDGEDEIELDGAQAVIATSKNGLRALAQSPAMGEARQLRVYAVGPGTAATAKALGFRSIVQGPKNARDMVSVIAEIADINAGPLVHLAGDTLAYDVAGELQKLGFHILQPVVYRTEAVPELSANCIQEFRDGRVDGVILLSPQTARVFVDLIRRHEIKLTAHRPRHFCLSPAVAKAVSELGSIDVVVANAPNLQEMLAAIDAAAANWQH